MKKLFAILFFSLTARAESSVVVSNPYLQDLVEAVSCGSIKATSILPLDTDPHTYHPTPKDMLKVSKSTQFIFISYQFEHWLLKQKPKSQTLEVAKNLPLRTISPSEYDLHIWQSPNLTKLAAKEIYSFLKLKKQSCLDNYLDEIDHTTLLLKKKIQVIPRASRVLATTHDAFGYFAKYLGLEEISLMGISTESGVTPRTLQSMIKKLKERNVKAVFIEDTSSSRSIETAAQAAGIKVGGTLYADGLGAAVPTILDMWKKNTDVLIKGLK